MGSILSFSYAVSDLSASAQAQAGFSRSCGIAKTKINFD